MIVNERFQANQLNLEREVIFWALLNNKIMTTEKLSMDFILAQYQSGITSYTDFTLEVGLWESEKAVFKKYLNPSQTILDLGCGTGRTTFPLYDLGYHQIRGLDYTPEMIEAAQAINKQWGKTIPFEVGDARQLTFKEEQFDTVIFSFNGLMSMPPPEDRVKAVSEIHRVLKKDGRFIFTTHDREADENFFEFWKAEKKRWANGEQNPQLYAFGDIITTSKNESREIFIHIPDRQEIVKLMEENGFQILDTFYRNERFDEPQEVKEKSGECRFWVAEKIDNK